MKMRMWQVVFFSVLANAMLAAAAVVADDKADLKSAFDKAGAAMSKVDYPEAAKQYELARQLAPKVFGANTKNNAVIINNLAIVYEKLGQYDKAEPLFQSSLEIRKALLGPEDADVAETLDSLGSLYLHMGNFPKADSNYQQSLKIKLAKLGPDHPSTADTLTNLGNLYGNIGEYGKAASFFERSLKIYQAKLGPNHPDLANNLYNLANLYWHTHEYVKAEPLFQRSLAIDEKQLGRDHPSVAYDIYGLAQLYTSMGNFAKAEPLFQRCLKIREAKLPAGHPDIATTLDAMGTLYKNKGDWATAVPLYLRSLKIRETALGPKHPDIADSLDNLADAYERLGKPADAVPLVQRGLDIRMAVYPLTHPAVVSSINNLATLYRGLGQYAKAEPLYMSNLKTIEENFGREHPDVAKFGLHNLAVLHAAQSRFDLAADEFDRARRIARKQIAQVLPALSEREQLEYLEQNDRHDLHVALSLGALAKIDSSIAERSATWLANGKAVAQETLIQRTALSRDNSNPNLTLIGKQLNLVRNQLAKLTNTAPNVGQEKAYRDAAAKLSEQELELNRQLNREGGLNYVATWVQLDAIRKSLPKNGILIDIVRFSPAVFAAKSDEVQFQPAHYFAWLTPSAGEGEVSVVDLGVAEKIDAAVHDFQTALKPCQSGDKTKNPLMKSGEVEAEKQLQVSLAEISKLVLAPLMPSVGKLSELFISPDASLWLVPWSALPIDGNYAVETWNIHYLISARDLVAERRKFELGPPRIFANPNYNLSAADLAAATVAALGGKPSVKPEKSTPPTASTKKPTVSVESNGRQLRSAQVIGTVSLLPGTASEAAAILPSLKSYAGEPKLLTSQQALEGVFKQLHSPRVLVLSTHGFFLPDQSPPSDLAKLTWSRSAGQQDQPLLDPNGSPLENPLLRCGLLLAGCNNREKISDPTLDDGILTGMEIVGTDLRGTQLVVLSACETGIGKVNNGEGVAGLRQAFQLAGAQAVVATLWQIPDQATAQLMNDFFANLSAGQSKSEALRNAQLKTIKARREKYGAAHPLFWAAFTLTGQ